MSQSARVLCEGIYFGEGPRWREGRLWFNDFLAKAVKSVSLKGDVRVEVEVEDAPSGLGWVPDGSMLIVAMTRRRVLRRSPSGETALLRSGTGFRREANDWSRRKAAVRYDGPENNRGQGRDPDGKDRRRHISAHRRTAAAAGHVNSVTSSICLAFHGKPRETCVR